MKTYIKPIAISVDINTEEEIMDTVGGYNTSGSDKQYTNEKNNTWDEEEKNSSFWGESAFESK